MLEDICLHLSAHTFRFTCERELQDGIATVLDDNDIMYHREYAFDKSSRIDFLVPSFDVLLGTQSIGIEVKVDGARFEVVRQLSRYADQPGVQSLILVTSRRRLGDMPATISGKDVRVVVVGGGF